MPFLPCAPPHALVHTYPTTHPHTTVNINQTHTSLDPYTPLKDNQTVRSTQAFHNVEKEEEQQHTFRLGDIRLGLSPSPPSSVSGTSVSVFFRLRLPPSRGHPSQGHPSRGHPSRGRPSSKRRRPKRMARTDIQEIERHENGGSIRLSFPSQGHPRVPFVSAIRLLQFNSSK